MQVENQAATGEVDPVIDTPAEIVEQPKSMDDTIRETLHNLLEKGAEIDTSGAAPDTPEEKAQRIRDEQGKFAKDTPLAPADPLIPVAPTEAISPAPNTWKKEAQDAWAKADPTIRAEVARREGDFHKGIEQYKQAAGFGQAMERAVSPYAATFQSLGISADRAVSEIMASDHVLRHGTPAQKQSKALDLMRSYGIDIAGLSTAAEQNYVDPNVTALQQQVRQQHEWIQNQTQQGQRQAEESLNSEISAFAADPTHSHFESVKGHMSALLQAGQAQNLTDAYEQAIYANPTTRAVVLAEQQSALRAEATKKAQAARQAGSVNVRTRPAMPTTQPIGTMDDTIRATLRRLQNA